MNFKGLRGKGAFMHCSESLFVALLCRSDDIIPSLDGLLRVSVPFRLEIYINSFPLYLFISRVSGLGYKIAPVCLSVHLRFLG